MLIRLAEPQDDKRIGDILVESFIETYAKKMPDVVVTQKRIQDLRAVAQRREQATVLVLEDSGEIIGTASLHKWGTLGSEAWSEGATCLRMLAITPAVQGRGLGRKLVEACANLTKEWGASALQLHIRKGAVGLARMYESLDFKRVPSADMDLLPEIFLEAYEKRFS